MSAAYLKSWFERVERNREERKALTDFDRGLFTEAKGNGYDGKALRKVLQRRAMGDAALAELDALVDAYEAALGAKAVAIEAMRAGDSPRQAAKKAGLGEGTARRAKKLISGAPPHDPATGEITETDRAVTTSSAPEGPAAGTAPRPESTPSSPAGASAPQCATDCDPVVASTPPLVIPAGEPDADRQGAPPGGTPAIACKAAQRESVNPGPRSTSTGMGGEPEPINPEYLADAARNYTEAVGAIRAGIVERGEARLVTDDDMPPIPDALRVGTEVNRRARAG